MSNLVTNAGHAHVDDHGHDDHHHDSGPMTVFGFAMIWHIWWLAIVSLVGTVAYFAIHAARDDQGYMVPVETIERIEAEQHKRLVAAKAIPATRVETKLEQA